MPDTERNARLAIQMGWKKHSLSHHAMDETNKRFCCGEHLPNFCGDDCAAVKWLLPFLEDNAEAIEMLSNRYKEGRARSVIMYNEDECIYGGDDCDALSLALASAVEGLEGGP